MKKLLLLLLFLNPLSYSYGQEKEGEYHSLESALINPSVVKSLDLSDKRLEKLPLEVLKLVNLEKIDLGENPNLDLYQTFEVLAAFKSLKILWLTEGGIKSLPNNISKLENLEELWLDDNELTEFPNPIKKLVKLKYLRLFSNRIKRIDLVKGDLPNLIYIDLCYNEFEVFPTELAVLPKLKRIVIWYNSINEIPEDVKRLDHVIDINLEHNNLTTLPKEISKLKSLQKLSLRGNQLDARSINQIYRLKKLQDLDLEQNNIENISRKVKRLDNLTRLNVSKNPLKGLPDQLSRLNKLEQIGLGELSDLNWVQAFEILERLPTLRWVGMFSMGLQKMPYGFENLKQVEVFWLTFNAFNKEEQERIQAMVPTARMEFK